VSKVIDRINTRTFLILAPIVSIVLTLVVVYGVACRYFLREPDVRVFFISVWIVGISYLFGFGYTLLLKGHVSVDILYQYLPAKARRALDIVSLMVIIFVCVTLLINAIPYAWRSTLMNELDSTMPMFAPPIWWYKWVLVIALIMAILQAVSEILKLMR